MDLGEIVGGRKVISRVVALGAPSEGDFREMVSEAEVDLIKVPMLADQGSLVELFQETPLDVFTVRNQAISRDSVIDAKKMNAG